MALLPTTSGDRDRPARQLDQLDTLYAHIFNFARWYRGTCTFSSKRRPRVDVIYGDYLRKVHIYDVHVHVEFLWGWWVARYCIAI